MSYVEQGAAAAAGEPEPVAEVGGGNAAPQPRRRSTRERAQRWRLPLMLGAPLLIIAVALYLYLVGGRFVSTNDANVESARATVASNVAGQVVQVDVHDNQFVHVGEVLFRLDPRPFDVAVEQAQAELSTSTQNIQASQASYAQRGAEIQAATSAPVLRAKGAGAAAGHGCVRRRLSEPAGRRRPGGGQRQGPARRRPAAAGQHPGRAWREGRRPAGPERLGPHRPGGAGPSQAEPGLRDRARAAGRDRRQGRPAAGGRVRQRGPGAVHPRSPQALGRGQLQGGPARLHAPGPALRR